MTTKTAEHQEELCISHSFYRQWIKEMRERYAAAGDDPTYMTGRILEWMEGDAKRINTFWTARMEHLTLINFYRVM